MKKVCPDLTGVMIVNDQVIGKAIHAAMAIDYSRQSMEQAKKNDIVKFVRHGKGACYGHCQEDGRQ